MIEIRRRYAKSKQQQQQQKTTLPPQQDSIVYQEIDLIYTDDFEHSGRGRAAVARGGGCGSRAVWCEVKAWESLVTEEEAASATYSGSERMLPGHYNCGLFGSEVSS